MIPWIRPYPGVQEHAIKELFLTFHVHFCDK